jgi:hypothetical protein
MSIRAGEGTVLNNLSELARYMGQPKEAWGYFEQALAIFEEVDIVDNARIRIAVGNWHTLAVQVRPDRRRPSASGGAGPGSADRASEAVRSGPLRLTWRIVWRYAAREVWSAPCASVHEIPNSQTHPGAGHE